MSKPNNNKEPSWVKLIRKRKISPLSPLSIMISPNFSLISSLSIEEVPFIGQTRDKASHVGRYCMVQWRAVIPKIGANLVVNVRYGDKSCKFVGEVDSNVSSASGNDARPKEDNPPMVRISWGIISSERMNVLVLKYRMPSNYVYRIPDDDEYVSTLGPLKVAMCEESL